MSRPSKNVAKLLCQGQGEAAGGKYHRHVSSEESRSEEAGEDEVGGRAAGGHRSPRVVVDTGTIAMVVEMKA